MSIQDVAERQHWDAYMDAYHDALTATHTSNSPWYVVPADDKKNARLIVSSILLNHIRKLKMDYPEVSPEFRKEMQEAKRMLESE